MKAVTDLFRSNEDNVYYKYIDSFTFQGQLFRLAGITLAYLGLLVNPPRSRDCLDDIHMTTAILEELASARPMK